MSSFQRIIDLSVPLNNSTPVYPGDPTVEISPLGSVQENGYILHSITFGNHAGTHIDAPSHMIENGRSLDAYPLDHFIGNSCYVDARTGFDLENLKNAKPAEGDIVLFDTGFSELYYNSTYFTDFPVLSSEISNYLVEVGVKMVGLDTCSADNNKQFINHKILLNNDILIIENLTNLQQLKGLQCTVFALPIKLNLDGAPARVIAVVES